MIRNLNLRRSLGIIVVTIAAGSLFVTPAEGARARADANIVCPAVPSTVELATEPTASQNPADLCEAIENGCLRGCERGAEILVSWGLMDEGDVDAYVRNCMFEHCDSPCKDLPN